MGVRVEATAPLGCCRVGIRDVLPGRFLTKVRRQRAPARQGVGLVQCREEAMNGYALLSWQVGCRGADPVVNTV